MSRKHPAMTTKVERSCRGRGSHQDALALVEWYLAQTPPGITKLTNPAIAEALGWFQRMGNARVIDMKRYHIARNHVRSSVDNSGKACTGYSLHFRSSVGGSESFLIDPTGGVGHMLEVALADLEGDLQQTRAFRTINGRRIQTCEKVADLCLSQGDKEGYGLMTEAQMEYQKWGALSDDLIARINLWLATASVTP